MYLSSQKLVASSIEKLLASAFSSIGLPKPRYARFWQLSNLRKSNFGREFFSLRATCFWLLRTYIPFYMGMLFLIWKELGMGKFPHSWLSSHNEKEFLHSRLRRSWRNTLSLFLLSHSWGNFFSLFAASPLIRKNPIPNSFQIRNSSYLPNLSKIELAGF